MRFVIGTLILIYLYEFATLSIMISSIWWRIGSLIQFQGQCGDWSQDFDTY